MKDRMSKARNYCFTINNYTDADEEALKSWVTDLLAAYVVYGKEVGESGTPHLQGYAEFNKQFRLTELKKLHATAHWEERKGTREQAVNYCKKDGEVIEHGVPKRGSLLGGSKGEKNKILPYMDLIKKGDIKSIAEDANCSLSVLKHVMTAAPLFETPRDRSIPMKVNWYYGPTGTGKTRKAYYEAERLGMGDVYIKASNNKWFDGYDGERVVIFDDLRSNWFEYSFLLKLLDRYPTRVECKGGSRQWKAEVIYVTSPFKPEEMYSTMQERDLDKDSIQQLIRRVERVEHMPSSTFPWTEPKDE